MQDNNLSQRISDVSPTTELRTATGDLHYIKTGCKRVFAIHATEFLKVSRLNRWCILTVSIQTRATKRRSKSSVIMSI